MDDDAAGDGLSDPLLSLLADKPEISQLAQQRLGRVLQTLTEINR